MAEDEGRRTDEGALKPPEKISHCQSAAYRRALGPNRRDRRLAGPLTEGPGIGGRNRGEGRELRDVPGKTLPRDLPSRFLPFVSASTIRVTRASTPGPA